MDSGPSPPSSDAPDAKPSFRKLTNDTGSRKYRRRSPADLSASSSSDGSPDHLRSRSPHPSKVASETDGYGRKNEDRDSDKQVSARYHDSHTHDDHDKHHKDSVEVGKNGRKSFQSIQESRSGNHIEQGRDERHQNKNRENSHSIDKYSDWHSKDKYEVDRCSRGKSDSRNYKSMESLDSHRHNGRQLASDRAVTGGRYGTSSYRDDMRTREQDRDDMSRERSRSGIRIWEHGRDDTRNRDRERDDMRSRNWNPGRDDKRSREWERYRDKRDQDEKRGQSKSPRDYKNDNKPFREEAKGHVKGAKISGDERAVHEKEIHSINQMDGDMEHKRKFDERDSDRHKDKFTQDPEMRTHYEVKGFSTVHDRDKRDERAKDKFTYSVSECSPKKQRSGQLEKPSEEDDVKGLAKLKQVKETPADVTSEGAGSYSQSEANQEFNAAKVAAMKAAELVNRNLVAVGGGVTGFLSTDQKKKLLWGNKKSPAAEDSSNRWDLPVFEDRERQEKFNKLMSLRLPWCLWPFVGRERGCEGGEETRQGRKPSGREAGAGPTGLGEAVHRRAAETGRQDGRSRPVTLISCRTQNPLVMYLYFSHFAFRGRRPLFVWMQIKFLISCTTIHPLEKQIVVVVDVCYLVKVADLSLPDISCFSDPTQRLY